MNPYTGYVDILVYPNGTVVPTTIYSSPSSFTMAAAFFHFWLAERGDITAPVGTTAPTLPVGLIIAATGVDTACHLFRSPAQGRIPAPDPVHSDRADRDRRITCFSTIPASRKTRLHTTRT